MTNAARFALAARWPGVLALVAVGLAHAVLSDRLTVGPSWLLLAVIALALVPAALLHAGGRPHLARRVTLGITGLAAGAIAASSALLVRALLGGRAAAGGLLGDAALLWLANVLVFAILYWEVDAGGPARRASGAGGSSDFLFPQAMVGGDLARQWHPEFLDYLFLSFNTSAAFSPTDTQVLARRAKVLMMAQALVSLVVVAVLAARAVNTL